MYDFLSSALSLTDTQLVIVFSGLLFGIALAVAAYLIYKRAQEGRSRNKPEDSRPRRRRKKKARRQKVDPLAVDEGEESYVMTLYDLLGVSPKASSEQIKKAYRDRVKNMHPDATGKEDMTFISSLNIAKHTLLDPKERKRYDAFLNHREEVWIREMAGDVDRKTGTGGSAPLGGDRVRVKSGKIPRLAPGERVYSKKNRMMDWDE